MRITNSGRDALKMQMIVWPLALAQTIVWASIFYSFPALLPFFETETGWGKAELTGAFTLALLASGVSAPFTGRLIDQGHGSGVLIIGTTASVFLLICLSQVTTLWQFYLVWMLLGMAMAASLYEPCFSIITHHLGASAKPAITRITLIAGLAGTVSFPAANVMASSGGWRVAVLCFAGAVAVITLPLTITALRGLRKHHPVVAHAAEEAPLAGNTRRRIFIMFSLAFVLININHSMIITHILPLLAERGVMESVALGLASAIGPMQVFGRLVMMATEKSVSTWWSTVACFASLAIGASLLWLAGSNTFLLGLFIVLHGAGWGTMSILRPVLTRELMGGASFGAISGRIFGLGIVGSAAAPFGGALLWQLGGYGLMLSVCVGLTTAALALMLWLGSRK